MKLTFIIVLFHFCVCSKFSVINPNVRTKSALLSASSVTPPPQPQGPGPTYKPLELDAGFLDLLRDRTYDVDSLKLLRRKSRE